MTEDRAKEIAEAVAEEHRFSRIEGKLDLINNNLIGVNRRLDISNGRQATMENRIDDMEKDNVAVKAQKRLVVGLLSAGAAFGGLAATIVFGIISVAS